MDGESGRGTYGGHHRRRSAGCATNSAVEHVAARTCKWDQRGQEEWQERGRHSGRR